MKPWIKWTVTALVLAALTASTVRTLSARKDRQTALEAQQVAQKTQVSIDLADTDLVQVMPMELQRGIAISGPLKAVNTAFVKARVPGELRSLMVQEGNRVSEGQILARIDPTESDARLRQAQQQTAATKAQVDIAQRSFDNSRALVVQGFISNTALETAQASLSAALANHAAAQSGADLAAKALDDTVLRAPIAGEIAQKLVQMGERVAVDTRIVEIVDNRQLELEASLNAADSLQVKVGQIAQLQLDGLTAPISAKVLRINPSASTGSRAVLVYLGLEPKLNLRHGLFAQGSLNVGLTKALALPLSAVRTDKPQAYVQVVSQNQVQHINVVMGPRGELAGQSMVAVTGVPEGSMVIDGRVGSLRVGTLVKVATTFQGAK